MKISGRHEQNSAAFPPSGKTKLATLMWNAKRLVLSVRKFVLKQINHNNAMHKCDFDRRILFVTTTNGT